MKPKEGKIDVHSAWKKFHNNVQDEPVPEIWTERDAKQQEDEQKTVVVEKIVTPRSHSISSSNGPSASSVTKTSHTNGMKQAGTASELWKGKRPSKLKKYLSAAAIVCVLTVTAMTPMGGKVMGMMLQTFRVQHVVGVNVSGEDLNQLKQALSSAQQNGSHIFEIDQYGSVKTNASGNPHTMTAKEVKSFGSRMKWLPGFKPADQTVFYRPSQDLTLTLKVKSINRLIKQLGGTAMFPQSADGQSIQLRIPQSFSVDLKPSEAEHPTYETLTTMAVPELNVPEGIDVNQVRKAILGIPFLPQDLRERIQGTANWQETLFVPITEHQGRSLQIDGYDAVLYQTQKQNRMLMWLQNGTIYMLSGDTYSDDASVIQAAKEIMHS